MDIQMNKYNVSNIKIENNNIVSENRFMIFADTVTIKEEIDEFISNINNVEEDRFKMETEQTYTKIKEEHISVMSIKKEQQESLETPPLEDFSATEYTIKNEDLDIKFENESSETDGNTENDNGDNVLHKVKKREKSSIRIYKCSKCSFKSKYQTNLHKHSHIHTNVKRFSCEICEYKTHRSDNFKKHILCHSRGPLRKQGDNVEETWFTCVPCDFETKFKYCLDQHMYTHKQNISDDKIFTCKHCTYESNKNDNFRKHLLTHQNSPDLKKYKCSLCDHRTARKDNLHQHMATHKNPGEIQMHKCPDCNFTTKYKKSLNKHILKHKNPSEKTIYKCELCSYATHTKYSLKPHMLTHLDESQIPKLKCDYCSFETKLRGNLNIHIRNKHSTGKNSIYICGICKYQTSSEKNLNRHMNEHEMTEEGLPEMP